MDGAKSSQREKVAKMSKSRRETIEVQSSDMEDDIPVRQSSSSSSSTPGKASSMDPGVLHRLTFRADPELLDPPGSKRSKLSRNEIEKLRRDRLNAYFMELAKLVPLVMQSNKKIDKASILRLTVAYLRIYHDLVKGSKRSTLSSNWRPDLVMYENLGNLLLESFGGFLLVINKKGMLIFATEAITKYLGHSLSDVLGSEVKNIIHPNDCEILMQQFEMTERDDRIKDTDDETDMAHVPVSGQRSFCVKMLNVLDPQSTCYELMHLVGHLKRMPPVDGEGVPTTFSGVPSSPEPSVCLVAVAKLVSRQPIQELYPVTDSTPNQWITRHELDGKITYSDQRGALLTGFLPGESIGFSPYSLLHPDDVSSVVTVHNLFLENGCVPLTVFRMFTKSREILYVQTNTHLVIDTWTSKPKFIISINTVLEEQDGLLALEDQSRRIEDKKRCIEVVQSTCSSNSAPSSIQSINSQDADDSLQSIQDQPHHSLASPPSSVPSCHDIDCVVIPEVEAVDESTIDIVVGLRKFRIQMTENPKYDPRSPPHNFSSINMVFDTYATKDDGGKSIPNVLPSFLSGAGGGGTGSIVSNQDNADAASQADSWAPSARSSVTMEIPSVETDESRSPGFHHQNGVNGNVLRRCVTVDDASSLAELLLQKDGAVMMEDAAEKGMENRDASRRTGGRHLLLRQLLVDKPQPQSNGRNGFVDGGGLGGGVGGGLGGGVGQSTAQLDGRPARIRVASVESMSKLRDEMTYGEFSQIKSLLQDGREPTKRSTTTAGIQNGRTTHNGDTHNSMHGIGGGLPSWNGVSHLARSTPSATSSATTLSNVRRSSESHTVATAPLGSPYHPIPSSNGLRWMENITQANIYSSVNDSHSQHGLGLNANGIATDCFASHVHGNGHTASRNGKYNSLEAQLRAVVSQENYTNSSSRLSASGIHRDHGGFAPANDSNGEQDMDSDVLHSSVTRIISRMPSADKYKFLKHLIAEQEKVYTIDCSKDDMMMGGEEIGSVGSNGSDEMLRNGSLQAAYTLEQFAYTTGPSSYATGQPTYSTGQPMYTSRKLACTTGLSAYTAGQSAYTAGQSAYTAGQPAYTAGQSPYTAGQSAYMTGQPEYAAGVQPQHTSGHSAFATDQPAYTAGQPTSLQTTIDVATLNGWCQDFGTTNSGGFVDHCSTATSLSSSLSSSVSLNPWTTLDDGVVDFDDSMTFLAQQNDISTVDWKSLVDDL